MGGACGLEIEQLIAGYSSRQRVAISDLNRHQWLAGCNCAYARRM